MGENPDAPLKIKLARKWTFIRPNIVFEVLTHPNIVLFVGKIICT
jgi:hypothetical protein